MKRFVSLFLVFLLTFGAVACSGDAPEETTEAVIDTTSAPETEPIPEDISLLNEAGEAAYIIVRPDEGSDREVQAGISLNKSLKELTGTAFTIKSDFILPNESVDDAFEILVGATNRPESTAAREELAVNEYVIRVVGNKIVIVGGTDIMTERAVAAFLALLDAEKGFLLAADMNVKEKIGGDSFIALTNQGESLLEVYDISAGKIDADSLIWSYKMPYYNIAGTKLRHSEKHGDVALAVCGNSYGCMVSYPDGKLLWRTEAAASNPHSIELMPNGVIAIASSSGGEVRFFTTNVSISKTAAESVVLEDAHGVLWDDEKGVLWAIGRTVLTAYDVTLADGKVTVTEKTELRATIPSDWSHDLAPVYGNTSALWVTTSSHVYQFDKNTKTFSTDYAGHEILDRKDVKGVGNFENGSLVYIYPDGAFKTWTSQSAVFMKKSANGFDSLTLTSATGHFYKIRVWDARYQ